MNPAYSAANRRGNLHVTVSYAMPTVPSLQTPTPGARPAAVEDAEAVVTTQRSRYNIKKFLSLQVPLTSKYK